MLTPITVIVDRDIPFISGVLEPYAAVRYLTGSEIRPSDLHDASALLVRSRTHCNEVLLADSPVEFIGTATVGTDHIDFDFCDERGIETASAPGCNAGGVVQHFFTALYAVAAKKGISLEGKTLGVIGVGHVGSRVADLAEQLGFRVLRNDPPREALEKPEPGYFCPLAQLLAESDIVTIHIPLEYNLNYAGEGFFSALKPGALFFNASRGEVVVEEALLAASGRLGAICLDVWRDEPNINPALLSAADIATPHIAGYSEQGKINGTVAVVRAFGRHFGIAPLRDFAIPTTVRPLDFAEKNQEQICEMLLNRYDIWADDAALRADPSRFEQLRADYAYRVEF